MGFLLVKLPFTRLPQTTLVYVASGNLFPLLAPIRMTINLEDGLHPTTNVANKFLDFNMVLMKQSLLDFP